MSMRKKARKSVRKPMRKLFRKLHKTSKPVKPRKTSKSSNPPKQLNLGLTDAEVFSILESQKEDRKTARAINSATKAKNKFRPKKSERNSLVMIDRNGKRNPQNKGRKGYLVLISKTGKKSFARLKGNKFYKLRNIASYKVESSTKIGSKRIKKFQAARMVLTKEGKEVLRCKDKFNITRKESEDYDQRLVTKMSKSLQECLLRTRSQRSVVIKANVIYERADSTAGKVSVVIPIDRSDQIAIEYDAIRLFVKKVFYQYLAKELMFDGLVTIGSSNHIRKDMDLTDDPTKQDWQDYHDSKQHDIEWKSKDFSIVRLILIEWRIYESRSTKRDYRAK